MPNDILLTIANQFLTPVERSWLSSCNRRFRNILSTPLRLKIVNSKGDATLQQGFFVSPADQHDDFTNYIFSHENLEFGKKYYFWTFDYELGNRVYLGRHTRHRSSHNEDIDYYTLGLRPCTPNQFWMITGGKDGDKVIWGDSIGLFVEGITVNVKSLERNATKSGCLSCYVVPSSTDTSGIGQWIVLGDNEDGAKENLQLMPCPMFASIQDITEQILSVHAIPEACENGSRLMFSPESEKTGKVCCDGKHGIVDFYFWVSQGIIHVQARILPFALGIPILQSDPQCPGLSPLANLLAIDSARWDCLVYYIATAADFGNGNVLDMERFLQHVKGCPNHAVVYDDIIRVASIVVRDNEVIRIDAPEVRQDANAIWKYMLTM